MEFKFSETLPEILLNKSIGISGTKSWHHPHKIYLLAKENDTYTKAFEIQYEYHCSPFKQAELHNNLLLAGHETHFYLFDTDKNKNLLSLNVNGYFSEFYLDNNEIYVCDSSGIYKISLSGDKLWENNNLGIDGVIINEFKDSRILGSGEWDPPGGWRDFILNKGTGNLL